MAERPVATGTEARAGSKEGVVRYVLLVSPVLVVVLFVVRAIFLIGEIDDSHPARLRHAFAR